jgi:hypothetical protein
LLSEDKITTATKVRKFKISPKLEGTLSSTIETSLPRVMWRSARALSTAGSLPVERVGDGREIQNPEKSSREKELEDRKIGGNYFYFNSRRSYISPRNIAGMEATQLYSLLPREAIHFSILPLDINDTR